MKKLIHTLALAAVSPGWLFYRLMILLVPGRKQAWFQFYSQAYSLLPGMPGVALRRAHYQLVLPRCPRTVTIGFGTILALPEAEIGDGVYIGAYCTLGKVTLGDDVLLGSNVDIMSGTHQHYIDRLDVPIRKQGGSFDRVRIGRDVWIGNSAVVAADVNDQAVIAAAAVVVKPVAARAIVGGNPARVLGERGDPRRGATTESGLASPAGDESAAVRLDPTPH